MSAIEINEEHIAAFKNALDITWEDPEEDKKLKSLIQQGLAYLMDKTGASAEEFLNEDGRAHALLYNYLLYKRAGSEAQFVKNYLYEINSLRRKAAVETEKARRQDDT